MQKRIELNLLKMAALFFVFGFATLPVWSQVAATGESPISTANWKTIRHDRHVTVRLNPDADPSLYRSVSLGEVAYTGPAKKLNSRDTDKVVSLLRASLTKDLAGAELPQKSDSGGTLIVNADITSVKRCHPLINLVAMAAVFVPVDLGAAKVTAWVVDGTTNQVIAEIALSGSGQIYQALASLQSLGQSKIVLKHESHLIAGEVARICSDRETAKRSHVTLAANE